MKFFYDDFTPDQICGVFTPAHYIVIAVYFSFLALALYLSRKADEARIRRITFVIAVVVTALEIVKIAIRVAKGLPGDDFIPLYFSSLFIYALWLSLSKNENLKRAGVCFISYGGVVGGTLFAIYPSTALPKFPLWHPSSIHSLTYHWLMLYLGALFLWKLYRPRLADYLRYFCFTAAACVAAAVLNSQLGTNLMYLDNPYGLSFLQPIRDASAFGFLLFAMSVQTTLIYFVCFGIHTAVMRILEKRHRGTENDASDG